MTDHTLLISVGGAPGPIIYSIRSNDPRRIIFFVSAASRPLVSEQILPRLFEDPGRLPDHEFIVTPDEQDLGRSVFVLLEEVPRAMARLGAGAHSWPQLVDYTAGTKTMSAAVVWASSRHSCRMSYIGAATGEGRNRQGLGTVIDGREVRFLQENPWDRVGWVEARSAIELFNRGQYANAADLMRSLKARISGDLPARLFGVLAEVFEGFHHWDIFDHREATRLLGKNHAALLDLAESPQVLIPGLKPFAEAVKDLFIDDLRGIKPCENSWALIYDLLANARRRAELEQKYEDAVARCYAAIEKIAQHELLLKYGIETGNALAERIPEGLREEYIRRYERFYRERDGSNRRRIQFGLMPAMELLQRLESPIGMRFGERKDALASRLAQRNLSILAHGLQPMDMAKFLALFDDAMYLLKIDEQDLTRFPTFPEQ